MSDSPYTDAFERRALQHLADYPDGPAHTQGRKVYAPAPPAGVDPDASTWTPDAAASIAAANERARIVQRIYGWAASLSDQREALCAANVAEIIEQGR